LEPPSDSFGSSFDFIPAAILDDNSIGPVSFVLVDSGLQRIIPKNVDGDGRPVGFIDHSVMPEGGNETFDVPDLSVEPATFPNAHVLMPFLRVYFIHDLILRHLDRTLEHSFNTPNAPVVVDGSSLTGVPDRCNNGES
jgi:hypothetical protein